MVDPLTARLGIEMSGMALSAMANTIKALYNAADNLNDWIDDHIKEMKENSNPTISRTGKVLEGAKFGFGVGYLAPIAVIAVGQFLLGNTLSAVATVASAATITNPIAMTCAAIGAIYYGWTALSDQERNDILDRISAGMEIGVEFVRSIVNFVTVKTKELLSSKQLAEIKEFIRTSAATFGKKLGDITRAVTDRVADAALTVKDAAGTLARNTSYGVMYTTTVATDTASAAAQTVAREAKRTSKAIAETASSAAGVATEGAKRATTFVAGTAIRAKDGLTTTLDANGDGRLNLDDIAHAGTKIKNAISPEIKSASKSNE